MIRSLFLYIKQVEQDLWLIMEYSNIWKTGRVIYMVSAFGKLRSSSWVEAAIATAQRSKDPVKEVSQATPKVLQGMFFGLWPAFLADPTAICCTCTAFCCPRNCIWRGKTMLNPLDFGFFFPFFVQTIRLVQDKLASLLVGTRIFN